MPQPCAVRWKPPSGGDAAGAWTWKTAYDACESAAVLFLRKYGKALFRNAGEPTAILPQLGKIADLLPTQPHRSEESQPYQQFSTPIQLGFAAVTAAAITPADRVLEPSAGTGLLAVLAEIVGGTPLLNELAEVRDGLLSSLFPAVADTRFDATQIDDHLDPGLVLTVVLMNPPSSVSRTLDAVDCPRFRPPVMYAKLHFGSAMPVSRRQRCTCALIPPRSSRFWMRIMPR